MEEGIVIINQVSIEVAAVALEVGTNMARGQVEVAMTPTK